MRVKESIGNQQTAMIKQLQENQLALSEGLDKNRLAITQGFDKMNEVKKWDLQQLPGYEAIEEPEKIKKDLLGDDDDDDDDDDDVDDDDESPMEEFTLRVPRKEQSKVVTFTDVDLDEGLLNAASDKIMKENALILPNKLKNERYELIKNKRKNVEDFLNLLKDKTLKNKANFEMKANKSFAFPKNENSRENTKYLIDKLDNIISTYLRNISKLEEYKKKTGQGILHFNNPLQLFDRLELLGGSILAGNNGVIQEFSQIAHLLNQMKVITKKQLNDLLKKYILNK